MKLNLLNQSFHWGLIHQIYQTKSTVKDESLVLETKGTDTLGLVQSFGTCLVSVSSQMKNVAKFTVFFFIKSLFSSRSRRKRDRDSWSHPEF